jgi:hypothetical protein
MKKVSIVLLFIFSINCFSQQKYMLKCDSKLLSSSLDSALAQVGVRERTGRNDGYMVEKYLTSVGLLRGNPYCAAGQYWSFYVSAMALSLNASMIPVLKTGIANSMYNDAMSKGVRAKFVPERNDLVVWRQKNSSHGHIERVFKVLSAGWMMTIGFNTSGYNEQNQAEGEGVFIKKRNVYYPLGRMAIRGLIGFYTR